MATRTPVPYAVVRALVRGLLAVFYERIDVVGAERIPSAGPLIVAANHHNSMVDAMLLLAVVPRRLRTLANAPLFKHPLVAPFLRLAGALPVQRRQEAGDDPAKNDALFAATTATLRAGGAILIFPERRTQPEPVLLTLRTGAARMLLAAESASGSAPVTLLPLCLVAVLAVILASAVLVLRAHYTMDVFTGAITALWVWTAASALAPSVDSWLAGLLR